MKKTKRGIAGDLVIQYASYLSEDCYFVRLTADKPLCAEDTGELADKVAAAYNIAELLNMHEIAKANAAAGV